MVKNRTTGKTCWAELMSNTNPVAKIFRANDLAGEEKNIETLMFVFLSSPSFRFKTLVKICAANVGQHGTKFH